MNVRKDRDTPDDSNGLRYRVEAAPSGRGAHVDTSSPEDVSRLIHELETHQTELEARNEELRRAQKELEETKNEYADIFDAAPVGYLNVSEHGQILEANLTAVRLLGIERCALRGQPLSHFIATGDREVYDRHRTAVVATESPQSCEIRMLAPDGKPFDVRIQSLAIRENDRAVTNIRTAISDITEHKQVEQALRLRERAMAAAANGIMLTDCARADNPIIYCNPAFEKITGYARDEVLGRNARFLEGDDSEQDGLTEVRAAIEEGRECQVIVRNYRKDGTLFWNELTISPVRNENGQLTCFIGIQNEITERKQAEQALREREEQLKLILASTGEGIFGMDQRGRCTFANRACVELLRYQDEKDLLGQDMHTLIHHRRRNGTPHPKDGCPIYQARCEDKVAHLEDEVLWRADGSSFPVDYRSYPMLRDGEVVGTVVSITDITERKEEEAQLLQAQKMDVLGQLTGGIAHDFNNLLTIIMGNLQFLKDLTAHDAEAQELVDDALSAARDGGELTHRLLAFSRKQTLQPKQVDINALLGDFGRFLRRTLRADITRRIRRGRDVSAVLADPAQLENALLNLVVNARDAMPEGGTLTIETSRQPIGPDDVKTCPGLAAGDYVMVSVSDTGIGLSPEDAARAVEPFFTTKPHGQGSGLGLSMVYGFVRQSGGDLRFSSEPGKGTTVSMLIPAAAPAVDKGNEQAPPLDLARGSETVLVLEDQSQVRKFAKRSLKDLGYRVLGAKDAAAASKVLQVEPSVDLLFSDIVLPGPTNGRELAEWAVKNRPELKVLLTTGFSQGGHDDSPQNSSDFPMLRKPYSRERLAEMVRTILDTH